MNMVDLFPTIFVIGVIGGIAGYTIFGIIKDNFR
tara:strand:- start:1481 stop:1582 length:102 start_codon:yes stop_codon:yes gene_type:complete